MAATPDIIVRRLVPGDELLAHQTFKVMREAFEEPASVLSDSYVERLLSDADFWAFSATLAGSVIGGVTGHALPMTMSASSEIFLYDLAVAADYQRLGAGRMLVDALCRAAADVGIQTVFVPADNDDNHALDFYRSIGGTPSPVTFFEFGPATTP